MSGLKPQDTDYTSTQQLAAFKPMWSIDEALTLIRRIQVTYIGEFHICLGGGVLNKGYSDHDLDLFIEQQQGAAHDTGALLAWLKQELGPAEELYGIDSKEYKNLSHYRHTLRYSYKGKRIDVFIA